MADLHEVNEWPEGIYQLETSDPVLGGPEGIDNLQGKQLASRTKWLRDQLEKIASGVTAVGKASKLATARALSFKGAATGTGSFDGSADIEITLALANSGVTAGSWPKVIVNSKGLVTGGSALEASDLPAVTTPSQFDNDTSFATTAFVNGVGLQFGPQTRHYSSLSQLVLTAGDIGSTISFNGTATQTAKLPPPASLPVGATVRLIRSYVNSGVLATIMSDDGTTKIDAQGGALVSSFSLQGGEEVFVTWSGVAWILGGTYTFRVLQMAASFSSPGHSKSPNGDIEMWGLTGGAAPGTPTPVTFPLAFPNACLNLQITYVDSGTQAPATRGGPVQIGSYSKTGFNYSHSGSSSAAQHFWRAKGY
ncbi:MULTISPECIES: gp53-like domain-containing protein [Pseudomonas]|uniref:gp53-like domain-containing protein n=1 Tax=Pseudomonas TaxID=286 RepID=UPI00087ACE3C|nr:MULTISPECIES: hypothetical protein [Pseudomonas]AZD92063.1 Phage tail fiber protein [Pseudomonas chlororaphis subsp. aureofaciens]KAB0531314.1 hypothetical protein F7R16_16000 [Pseudomonas chlororaphis subsp. aureofaciens]TSD32362.1 hypothetical protein FCE86_023215 [Pseudomonas sp. ATCC 13985]WDG62936.1 hypothetical protein PUP52_13645 [Pseudomonas chlororaphis]WDG69203.1 hypothetical protein PUP59_13945 [Pseudomonas chlororaphis]